MAKLKALHQINRQRRTSLDIEEEQMRTLYIRIPHTIKDADEIRSLFFGTFRVKLPRQSGRYCHVIFSNIDEKIKNLKALKKIKIDGKSIIATNPRPINLNKKPKQKKIVMPDVDDEPPGVKYLYISNIPPGVKASEVKQAFPGSVTIALLKGPVKGQRQAKLKMSSSKLCMQYINKELVCPTFKGQKVKVVLSKKSKKSTKKKSKSLKVFKKAGEKKDSTEDNSQTEDKAEGEESEDSEMAESDDDSDVDETVKDKEVKRDDPENEETDKED